MKALPILPDLQAIIWSSDRSTWPEARERQYAQPSNGLLIGLRCYKTFMECSSISEIDSLAWVHLTRALGLRALVVVHFW